VTLLPCALFLFRLLIAPKARSRFFGSGVARQDELPIIQRVYDLILWYVPRLNSVVSWSPDRDTAPTAGVQSGIIGAWG